MSRIDNITWKTITLDEDNLEELNHKGFVLIRENNSIVGEQIIIRK